MGKNIEKDTNKEVQSKSKYQLLQLGIVFVLHNVNFQLETNANYLKQTTKSYFKDRQGRWRMIVFNPK